LLCALKKEEYDFFLELKVLLTWREERRSDEAICRQRKETRVRERESSSRGRVEQQQQQGRGRAEQGRGRQGMARHRSERILLHL
jgi:hypothetical protein